MLAPDDPLETCAQPGQRRRGSHRQALSDILGSAIVAPDASSQTSYRVRMHVSFKYESGA